MKLISLAKYVVLSIILCYTHFSNLPFSILISLLTSSSIPDNGTQFLIYTKRRCSICGQKHYCRWMKIPLNIKYNGCRLKIKSYVNKDRLIKLTWTASVPAKKDIKKRTHLFQMDSFFHDSIEFYSSANSSSFLWIISSIFSIYNATSLIFSHRSIR